MNDRGGDSAHAPAELLISRAQLAERIEALAEEIKGSLQSRPFPPVFVGVLKGSTPFLADLLRNLDADVMVDFMSISSYGQQRGSQSGVVRIYKDLEIDVTGRDIVIVEDIVDTGLTLTYLRKTLQHREPGSLRAATLLDKSARRIVPVPVEFVGFEIPDVFVVGYGMDFQGLYRNVPDILAVRDLPRLANDPRLLVEGLFSA
jgi:hypoxanthine phosphoribosyltransferase